MGSCASKPTPPPTRPTTTPATQSTQAKRQQQKQAIANPKQNQPIEPQTSSTNGQSVESTKLPSSDSSHIHENKPPVSLTQQQQQQQNGGVVVKNPVDVAAQNNSSEEIKILLLGSGESGKSTIVKQMKILHQDGYTQEELYEYRAFVYKNILDCIKNVINAIIDLDPELINDKTKKIENNTEEEEEPETAEDSQAVVELKSDESDIAPQYQQHILEYDDLNEVLDYEYPMDSDVPFNASVAAKIKKIYNTPEVQHFMVHQQGNFYLIDSTSYFLSDIDRIAAVDYIPSINDVLRTRKKTSGIFDFRFDMGNGLNIHMYDVGGQRSERKKWIHCFDNVTLIIFCVALSEYDQVLLEENNQNRLEESLALFDSVVNSRWFARTSVVLFLNKIDVFADKLQYSPLEAHFPDYTGGNNINKAAKYILWRFNQLNRSGLNIYPHVTQAIDTSNVELVFAAVKETILENSLRDTGIL
ncbi:Guanine nucleotide-binding protein alpha-2 subunit [Spathaspora sp. JA1]|nr:Guanine nucleotide-binding protein alpha-2 subunit [Spathaspora sp. JA1]